MPHPIRLRILLVFTAISVAPAVGLAGEGERQFDVDVGLEIHSPAARFSNLQVSFVLPRDWPEQDVEILDREASPGFRRIKIVDRRPGARQVQASLSRIDRGQTARLVYHLRITRRPIALPTNPSILTIPKDPPKDAMGESPLIEIRHPRVRDAASRALPDDSIPPWEQARQLDDASKNDVRYSGVAPLKGALAAIVDQHGDCEERTSVFVAYCRIHGIPARSVWIPNHAYAEFMLEDPQTGPRWFPVESVGREFGFASANDIILQKGDSYRVRGHSGPQRYITETVSGNGPPGAHPPQLRSILDISDVAP